MVNCTGNQRAVGTSVLADTGLANCAHAAGIGDCLRWNLPVMAIVAVVWNSRFTVRVGRQSVVPPGGGASVVQEQPLAGGSWLGQFRTSTLDVVVGALARFLLVIDGLSTESSEK